MSDLEVIILIGLTDQLVERPQPPLALLSADDPPRRGMGGRVRW